MTALFRLTHDQWSADRAFVEMRKYEFEKGLLSHKALKSFLFDFYDKVVRPRAAGASWTDDRSAVAWGLSSASAEWSAELAGFMAP